MLRRVAIGLVALMVLAGAAYGVARARTCCSALARAVSWGESDIGDQARFPARRIAASGRPGELRAGPAPAGLTAPVEGEALDRFLASHDTRAFLVVHDGRVVYERYFHGASPTTRETSFSAAKSILSTLIGIAIAEGAIGGVDDPVTDYVPELARRDRRFSRITLRHLLAMASGIRYVERGMPWSDDAVTYYGADLRAVALERPKIEGSPGRRWVYNNFHPLLLGLVLERATKQRIADYASRTLWRPLGAEADATWSLDSTEHGFEKLESGFNARPRDYARFGLMMLDRGRSAGAQIVPRDWVEQSTRDNGVVTDYGWLWWVNPGSAFSARGKFGQLIQVVPERDTVVVRLGAADGGVDWSRFALDLAERLRPVARGTAATR